MNARVRDGENPPLILPQTFPEGVRDTIPRSAGCGIIHTTIKVRRVAVGLGTAATGCLVERSSTVFWGCVYLDLLRAFGPRTADGGCPHMGLMKVLR